MTTQTAMQTSAMSFVTMVENLVAGEHLEKNPWTPDAMWHNIANQTIDALVARGKLRREEADVITGQTPLAELPTVLGCPDPSPIWRCIYTAYRLTAGSSFSETKAEIRNIMARRAVTTKQFSFMLGVIVDRDVRRSKARKEPGARRPASLQRARNAFGDGGFLTEDVPGRQWFPVFEPLSQLLERALGGDRDARITLMIGGGFALMMDGHLTRDRESKLFEGSAPFRGSPPAILTDLAGHEHGLRMLAAAWQHWDPSKPEHEYDIPVVNADGSVAIAGDTRETRSPERLTEYRLYEIASPAKAMAGFLKQQEARKARNQAATPEDRDRHNRERLAMALDIAKDAATALKNSPVSPPPHPFGMYEEWERTRNTAHQVYEILVRAEPDPEEGFISSTDPEEDEDAEHDNA
ncbi:hypothetical protein GCM10010218_01400 [Streptomyces mashuensis]|uniref:Uncharacterized protein n=1 Tax=Streptomyces mashuensis TaxID=33904 RepID=A0A919ASB0_9ACTN|nr:hypothetical protein [Streptomyces mashuensis]GHF24570.1 hypothetical protein GCM10010218_01400 [Streptomyces mashuensis]